MRIANLFNRQFPILQNDFKYYYMYWYGWFWEDHFYNYSDYNISLSSTIIYLYTMEYIHIHNLISVVQVAWYAQ